MADEKEKKEVKKRVATGVTTSDLVMSAYTLNNEDIFPNILFFRKLV